MPLCSPSRAMPCPARYEGIRAGVIWFSVTSGQWLCLDKEGVPRPVRSCPWCGKGMPTEIRNAQRIVTMSDLDFQRLQGDGDEGSEVG